MKLLKATRKTVVLAGLLCALTLNAFAYTLTYQTVGGYADFAVQTTTEYPWTVQEDGSLRSGNAGKDTIAGKDILGDLTFTAQTIDGSWTFIEKGTPEGSGYVALANDTKIALLTAGKLDSGNYLLGSEGMYWSGKYDAYVKIVGSNETADTLTARLTLDTGAQAQEIGYTGDINGSNSVTPADGGMINDVLHSATLNYTLTEKQRLEMDVNGDRKVTTADIQIILYRYVGLSDDGQ